jgi:predicted nucleic acid-binding protein
VAIYYLDSSAIVKRHVAEVGSAWVISITDPAAGHRIYVANIAGVEVPAAINKRVREGSVNAADAGAGIANFQNDFANQYNAIQVTDAIITRAGALTGRYRLRAYDAVQLAAALEVNRQIQALGPQSAGMLSLAMVCADGDLNAAATAEGLGVDNPNNHP